MTMEDLTASQESLYQCVLELELSERKYHDQLNTLSDLYILHLKTCVISGEEVEKMLLTKIKDMIDISVYLYTELAERLKDWDEEESQIGDIFLTRTDLWDIYKFYCTNLESALGMYDEKMMRSDFAELVSLKQGMDNASLKDLILLPIERLKNYKEFFKTFLERTVNSGFIFSHPDFSAMMECKKKVEEMIPYNYDALVKKKQVDDYKKIESMLGDQMAPEFSAFIKHIHEEPASSKRWKKRSYKRTPIRRHLVNESAERSDQIDIGGRKFREECIPDDILNALKKEEETQVMVGMVSPKRPPTEHSACDNYVTMEDKVKVRWENEVHSYTLLLFRQCLIFSKVRNRSMKIARIIKLRNMWVSEYNESIGFGQVEKQEQTCIGGWVGTEGWEDDELLHRAVLHFPNNHVRRHWFTLFQRHIKQSREKSPVSTGSIKVYFKGSDSRLSLPSDSIWEGVSCQDLQIDISQSVEEVIQTAVTACQMIDNAYTLTFIILQDTKIVYEEQLIWMEMPLIIQIDTKTMFTDQRTMQPIFLLRHNNFLVPPTRQRASTLTQFFRRAGRGVAPPPYARVSTMSDMQVAAQTNTHKMFGLSISKFMSQSSPPQEVPGPLLDILIYIYTNCFDSEGIFRKPGSRAVQRLLEDRLDNGETIDWNAEQMQAKCYLPNVASSLLKNYFRSLPQGLFPKVLFPEFERWRAEGSKLSDISLILAKIPEANMTFIRYTFHVLKRIVDYSSVNLMTADNLATCIGPSLVTWPEDANALSIHADQNRTQTPSVVVAFLLGNVSELFGSLPNVLSKNTVKDDEVSLSRRSRLSNEANQENESSEDEGEKSNMWLRTLLRSSINEHSTSSSMFVEIGSPPAGKRTPSPVTPIVVPHTLVNLVKEAPRIQTIHSQALQSPLSVSPEQCDLPDNDHTPTETKTFFRFSTKKSRNSKSDGGHGAGGGGGDVSRKKGSSLRRSRKSKKDEQGLKCSSVSDISSEDEVNKRESVFVRNTRSIREEGGGQRQHTIQQQQQQQQQQQLQQQKSEHETELKRNSFSGGCSTSRLETRVASFQEQERSEVVLTKGAGSFREHRTLSADDKDDIHKIKEHPVAKRVLVKHKSTKVPVSIQHSYPETQCGGGGASYSASLQHCTSLINEPPSPGPAKEGHDLAHLVSSLEKLTNPRLAPYRKFGGSIGTESGTSSNDDESVVEQESYV